MRDSDRECPASKRRRERQNTFVFTHLPPAHPPNHIHLSVDLKEHQSNLPIRAPEKGYRTSKKRVEQEAKKKKRTQEAKKTHIASEIIVISRQHLYLSPSLCKLTFRRSVELTRGLSQRMKSGTGGVISRAGGLGLRRLRIEALLRIDWPS